MRWLRNLRAARTERKVPVAEAMEPRLLYSADIAAGLALAATVDTGVEQRTLTDSGEYAAASSTESVRAAYATAALSFEANEGQAAGGADFIARGSGYGIALQDGNATLTLLTDTSQQSVTLTLAGARGDTAAQGEDLLATRSNSIVGNDPSQWRTDLANYAAVIYRQVYDGVDVRYYGTQRQLEYDFIVAPGADAAAIRLQFGGVTSAEVADNGDLVLAVAGSGETARFKAPVSYQRSDDGSLHAVASSYVLHADGSIGFALGAYDDSRELVIDPVLSYASYLGGSNQDAGNAVAVDAAGNVYVTGRTTSSDGPMTAGIGGGAGPEIFVAKLSPDLSTLLFSTRIGGNGEETGNAIAVDASGNIAVTGWTKSTNFPLANADDSSVSGQDAVVFKLNSSGALVFGTYFGGNGNTDSGNGVAFDSTGNVYVTGQGSDSGLLPFVLQLLFGSSDNAFVNKYSPTGTAIYQQLLGGSGNDLGTGIAVGAGGDVYVVGNTSSGNLSTTGGQMTSLGGAIDGFLAHLDASGNTLYSTYVGAGDADTLVGVAIDGTGKAYVVGETRAKANAGFVTTTGSLQATTILNNTDTGFIRVYDTTKTGAASMLYSSYLGGNNVDRPTGVAYANGRMIVVGTAGSTAAFPLTADAVQSTNTGGALFMLVVNPANSGADLQYGTLYGSGMTGGGVAVRGKEVYVAASANSTGWATAGAAQTARSGTTDAFVVAFRPFGNAAPVLTSVIQPSAMLEDSGIVSVAVTSLETATDADGDIVGIAVVATDSSQGNWFYSLDGGTTWIAMGARTAASALLLPGDGLARVGFVPAANYNGTIPAGLSFRAWDRSTGAAGGSADTTVNGGTTAFSASTGSIDVVVTPVNDAPVLSGVVQPPAILEDSTGGAGFLVSTLVAGQVTDVDAGALRGIAVTAVDDGNGIWQYTLDGTTWTTFGAASATSARLLNADGLTSVRFIPNANWNGTVANGLSFLAWDRTTGTAGGVADTTVNGGNSAFSSASRATALTVTPVDDPVFWLTTAGNVASPSGVNGLASWQDGDVLQFGDPNLALEPGGSAGTMSFVFNVDQFAANGAAEIDALHYVTRDVTVGTTTTMALRAGDILFSTVLIEDFASANTITGVQDSDLVLFRPTTPGDYSSGTFTILLDESAVSAANDWLDLSGVALVEKDTVVGDTTVRAGSFLMVDGATASRKNIKVFTPDKVGATTDGTMKILVDGTEAGLGGSISSLAFIQDPSTVGGTNLAAGTILISQDGSADINALTVTGTELGGTGVSAASKTLLLNGAAVGLDTANEAISAFTLVPNSSPANQPPTLTTMAGPADTTLEDTTVQITLAELKAQANEADADGTVDAFVVNAVSSGTLRIGASAATASLWAAGTNDSITAGLNAYWTPAADVNGIRNAFTVVARDDDWAQSATPVQVQVNVTAVNDAPVANADTASTSEDNSFNINVGTLLTNDTDVEGSALSVVSVSDGVGGTVSWSGGGSMTFTPNANFNGVATFFYKVSDGTAVSALATVFVTVTPVNDPPVAVDDVATTAEDTPITFTAADLLANDSDVEGNVLVIESVNSSRAVLNADGSVTFTPDANGTGPVTFKYRISDGTSTSNQATVTVNITPVDDASVLAADTKTVAEDTVATGNVLTNDVDVDDVLAVASFQVAGDTTVYTAGQAAAMVGKGTVSIAANGAYTFTPVANWNGLLPQVSYITNTGSLSTLDVTVTAVDDPTVMVADSNTVAEDTIATGNVLANDSDVDSPLVVADFKLAGDTVIYLPGQTAVVAGKGSFTLAADGSYSFTPLANWNGAVPLVTYSTTTGVSSTLAITVTAVDDASVLVADSHAGTEDNVASGNVLGNDSDVDNVLAVASFRVAGDATVYTAGQGAVLAGGGTFTLAANGNYTFTPLANWNGIAPVVTYTTNTAASSTLTIALAAVDDASVLAADSQTVAEDTVASGNVLTNDSDVDNVLSLAGFRVAGDLTVYTAGQVATVGGKGTISLAADGSYTFTPLANWNGALPQVSYTTNTGATSTLDITLTAVDDPTVVTADSQSVAEDATATGNVLANDSDVDNVLSIASFQIAGDATVYAAGLTATLTGIGTVTLNANGSYSFTPLANWNGAVPVVSYTTNTGVGSTLAITVAPVDDASMLTADSNTVSEDTVASGNVLTNDSDVDNVLTVASFKVTGDATVYMAGQAAVVSGIGSFTLAANGDYSFTPLSNWNGSAPRVSYTTNTGSVASLDLTVAAVDDATVVVDDGQTIAEDSVAGGNVLANDSDVDNALAITTFRIAGDSAVYVAGDVATVTGMGTLTLASNGDYSFTPLANWNGSVPQVSYTTNTGAVAKLDLTVTAVDDPTDALADAQSVPEDTVAAGNVLSNDSDIDSALAVASFQVTGDATVYAAGQTAVIAGKGSITLLANGGYSFTPLADWNGPVPVVSYLTTTSASSTLAITVTPVDDASVLAADNNTVAEDSAATGNVLSNDSDVDNVLTAASFKVAGDATVYTAGQAAVVSGIGSFTLAVNGSYTFTPLANWNGSAPQVSYTTNTGLLATLDITVTAVDDATVAGADAQAVAEDTLASGNVLANDSDVDNVLAVASFQVAGDGTVYAAGQTATVVGVGTITLAANGAYTFTPLADWNGTLAQVSYTSNTGTVATLDITVTAVDDATIATADNQAVPEDTVASGNVLTNDSDIDDVLAVASFRVAGDATVYTAGQAAVVSGIGSITLAANGSYSFTPFANWFGNAPRVSYITSTGSLATLDLTVTAVDDATVAGADAQTVVEDTLASGNVLANDSDVDDVLAVATFQVAGDGTVYAAGQAATAAGMGTITLAANGAYSFTPLANWNGSVPQVSYTTNTGALATLDLTVTAVDDATDAHADAQSVPEDTVATGNVLTNDADVDSTLAVASFMVTGDATVYAAGQTAVITGKGNITLLANGGYIFTPQADWNGTLPQVSYTTNTAATSTLDLSVTAVDDPTVPAPDSQIVPEDTVATGNVLANDVDVDSVLGVASFQVAGDATVYTAGQAATLGGIGTITLATNGSYSFTPMANWNGGVPRVSYTTNTGAVSTLDLTVSAVDDATVTAPDAQTILEDGVASGNVLANDSDVDSVLSLASFRVAGDANVYTAGQTATVAGAGTIVMAANGSFTFTPAANWNGALSQVTYTTNTGAVATLDVTVTAVDDATVAAPDSQSLPEDTVATGNVLANDSDVDSALAVASFQVAGNATVYAAGQTAVIAGKGSITLLASGGYSFTPLANWNGALTQVSYTTSTGALATLDITVTPVDDASVAAADAQSIFEDGVATGNVLANDSDVDSVLAVASFQVAGDAALYAPGQAVAVSGVGAFTLAANGAYTFTPLANWNGNAPQVRYLTNTGASSTLDLAVTAVDDATFAAADSLTVAEDNVATGNVLANDVDVDSVLAVASFQLAGDTRVYLAGQSATVAGMGTITLAADGTYSFTPLANWNGGAPQVIYTTNTGAMATLDVTVTAVDDASVARADSQSAGEDTVAIGNVLANDSDVDDVLAVASFQVAGDATVYVAGQTAAIAGMGTFSLAANGAYTFTPAANWNGLLPRVSYTTSTGASAALDLTVTAVDDATVARPDSQTVAEDSAATGNVLANDSDIDSALAIASFQLAGDSMRYNAGQTATLAGIGTVSLAADGSYTFTPLANWNGPAPLLRYLTTTGASSTLAITVTPVDDASVLAADTQAGVEDTVAAGNVLANDSDVDDTLAVASFQVPGDAKTYAAGQTAVLAGIGSISLGADGAYRFTPLADWNGAAPLLTYTTSTGASATLALAVTPVNDAPIANADVLAATEDTPVTYRAAELLGNDTDVEASVLAISSVSSGAGGTVVLNVDGSVTFTPDADFDGTARFSYQVSDGSAVSVAATVNVKVAPVEDAPVIAGGPSDVSLSVAEQRTAVTTVRASDPDLPAQPLAFSIGGGADAGRFVIDPATGALSFAAAPDYEAPVDANGDNVYHVVVRVSDGLLSTTQTFTVTVQDVGESASILPAAPPAPAPAPAPPAPAPAAATPAASPVAPPVRANEAASAPAAPAATTPGRTVSISEVLAGVDLSANQVANVQNALSFAPQQLALGSIDSGVHAFRATVFDRSGVELVSLQAPDLSTAGFGVSVAPEGRQQELQRTLRSANFAEGFDRLRQDARQNLVLEQSMTVSVAGVSLGLSLVYLLWLVRGGVLMGSYLSALPAWRILDPLPVLARPDEEGDDEDEDLAEAKDQAHNALRGFG